MSSSTSSGRSSTSGAADVEHEEALAALDRLVREAKGVPLSASVVIPKEEALNLLRELRDTLPRETEEAREVLGERDRVLAEARSEADRLVAEAREERARLVAEESIVQEAQQESRRVREEAQAAAEHLKTQADDYVDAKLANFEILLNKVLRTVHRGREQLRRRLEAAQDEVRPLDLEDSGEISGPFRSPGPDAEE